MAIRQGWVGAVLQDPVLPSLVTAAELLPQIDRFYRHALQPQECLALAGIPGLASRRVDRMHHLAEAVRFADHVVGSWRLYATARRNTVSMSKICMSFDTMPNNSPLTHAHTIRAIRVGRPITSPWPVLRMTQWLV